MNNEPPPLVSIHQHKPPLLKAYDMNHELRIMTDVIVQSFEYSPNVLDAGIFGHGSFLRSHLKEKKTE